MLTNTSNSNVLNIEMASINGNRCDGVSTDDDECKTLMDLLNYGCAENCDRPDFYEIKQILKMRMIYILNYIYIVLQIIMNLNCNVITIFVNIQNGKIMRHIIHSMNFIFTDNHLILLL